MKPFTVPGSNRYCRLLPPRTGRPALGTNEAFDYFLKLIKLVLELKDDGSASCSTEDRMPIASGYTYFGQFVDHDLTKDTSKLEETWLFEPGEIYNSQAPRLDLSHLYGKGPWDDEDRRLYDDVRLKVGRPPLGGSNSFDIAFSDVGGGPLVADSRALENVILREMTAVFCCLHNLAVEQLRPRYPNKPRQLFEMARLRTTWQFQRLVSEDYLRRVLDATVYESVFLQHRPTVKWSVFSIPVEFSAAAMRFGHSMVRDKYFFLADDFDLIDLVDPRLHKKPLPVKYEIDWGRFFQNASSRPVVTAQPIDTGITPGLLQLTLPTIRLFNPGPTIELFLNKGLSAIPLPFLSLARGVGLRLPTGQSMASAFGEQRLSEKELTTNCHGRPSIQGDLLKEYQMTEKTPLWYYLLKESEIRRHGNCLGPTGSRIVAETIYAALLHDPNSYLNHPDANSTKLVWDFPGGAEEIVCLRDLFVHAAELFRI